VGIALFISHYAPRKLATPIGYVIDLLAAIPSVVFGAWGMITLSSAMVPIYGWLHDNLGFIPCFAGSPSTTGRTLLTSGVVLAVMILPIITSLCREIFLQTPKLHEEAALALGATQWEMVKMTVFPFARAGIISWAWAARWVRPWPSRSSCPAASSPSASSPPATRRSRRRSP
jgi:phosphate transport system permease protein